MNGRACLFAALAMSIGCGAVAQEVDWKAAVVECRKITDAAKSLVCIDEAIKSNEAKEQALAVKNRPKPLPNPRIAIRDSATSAEYGAYDLGSKGGSISIRRENGQDATVAKVAAFLVWEPNLFNDTMSPFLAVGWNRDGAGAKRSDTRDLAAGIKGNVWQSADQHNTLFGTFQLTHREDLYDTSGGNQARAHFDFVNDNLASALGWRPGFVPQAGLLMDRRNGGTAADGNWRSVYVGANVWKNLQLGDRWLQASLLARWLGDTNVPSGNTKRRLHYANLSVDYYFYDPDNKKAPLQPSLFISREVGTDFLTGVDAANKTTAGIRFKFH